MNIAIWGFGEQGKKCEKLFADYLHSDNVVCFVDKDVSKQNENSTIAVISPIMAATMVKSGLIDRIVIPGYEPGDYREIVRKLFNCGIRDTSYVLYASYRWFMRCIEEGCNSFDRLEEKAYEKMPLIGALEYEVAESCNLNCKRCNHYSNINHHNNMPTLSQFVSDIEMISTVVCEIKRFKLLGGEPLLNHDIDKFFDEARRVFPDSYIAMVTNGLLIKKSEEKVWESCRRNNIVIEISVYPPFKEELKEVEEELRKRNCTVKVFRNGDQFGSFINLQGNSDKYWAMMQCYAQVCHAVKNGKIYKCASNLNIDVLNEKFGINIPQTSLELISLKNDKTPGRTIREYLANTIDMCEYCTDFIYHPWERSYNEVSLKDWLVDEYE